MIHNPSNESFAAFLLRLRAKALDSTEILHALEQTPRGFFVDAADADIAYHNRIHPIECGEYIERIDEQMAVISALKLDKNHRLLEIGTGSGFSAALMARMVARVTTIECYKTLIDKAQLRFQNLKINNIILHHGDAHHGLATHHGAFDRIIIWPSCQMPPQIFIDRLAVNGMMIVPIGQAEQVQNLTCVSKTGSRLNRVRLLTVRYQPMLSTVPKFL